MNGAEAEIFLRIAEAIERQNELLALQINAIEKLTGNEKPI